MKLSDHLQSGLLRLTGWVIRRFSIRTVQKMARGLGLFACKWLRVRRDVALANLKLCFPEKNDQELEVILRAAYVNIATVLFEFLYFPKLTLENLDKIIEFPEDARRLVEDSLTRGKGLVMMSGHFSNWELIALTVGASFPGRMQIIVHPFHNSAVDRVAEKIREHLGNSTVPMANSVRAALTRLKSNGIVALLADQSAAKESAPAEFFGLDVPTFQGPSSFVLRTRADMHFGFLVRKDDGRYVVVLKKINYDDLTEESEENVRELTRRHVAMLEEIIREYPSNWLWFHRRFKHLPEFQRMLESVRSK